VISLLLHFRHLLKKHARKLEMAKRQITIKGDFKAIPEEFKDYIP